MTARDPLDVLQALAAMDERVMDAEIDRVLALTPEQLETELRDAGFDVEAEKAKAAEWLETLSRGELPVAAGERAAGTTNPPPPPPRDPTVG
jgi:hypothetical protein